MRFEAYRAELAEREVLSIDGIAPRGPNLSHWPGNRTPPQYRATTSTGMVLLARRDAEGWRALERKIVTNNHFDTDGVLSIAAALRPELVAREAMLLATAEAGDLERFVSREAIILDRCLAGLNEHPASPLAGQLHTLSREERLAAVYDYALVHLDDIAARPEQLGALWREELEVIERDQARLGEVKIERRLAEDLAIIASKRRVHRAVLRKAVAPLGRQLEHWGEGEAAFTYAIDTWFDAPGLSRSARHPLAMLAARLQEADPTAELSAPREVTVLWPELRGRTSLSTEQLASVISSALQEADAQTR